MNDLPRTSLFHSRWFAAGIVAIAVAISLYTSLCVAILENHHEDLWIYSSGSRLGMSGFSPYESGFVQARVSNQYPGKDDLINNCGFFLTPQAILEFVPALIFPWTTTKVLWCIFTVGLGASTGWYLLKVFTKSPPLAMAGLWNAFAAFAMLCNPMSLFALVVGQTSIFFFACVVLGQLVRRKHLYRTCEFIWALAFIKPHMALPLMLLAWYDGGWRRVLGITIWVVSLNLFASAIVSSPSFFLEYVQYLGQGHQTVEFNRVAINTHISSWNRLLIALGGPAFELGAVGTLAGYAVWFGLCAARCCWVKRWPSLEWALATVGCGIPLCCQTLPYELPVLLLVLPWVFASFRSGGRIAPALAILAGAMALQLGGDGSIFHNFAAFTGSHFVFKLMESHQSLFVAVMAGTVLFSRSCRLGSRSHEVRSLPDILIGKNVG